MNSNALYIPLSINQNNMAYYAMLHYSLKTLHQYYNNEFDVIISVSSSDFDIWEEDYMGLNLVKDFPNVKFFKSNYHAVQEFSTDPFIHKWYDLDKVFDRGYNLVFCFDCDTIFYTNIDYFFTKYDDGNLWALFEGPSETLFKVLNRNGMAGGQIMFPKHIFEKIPNFSQNVVNKQRELVKLAYEILDEKDARWFEEYSEQYSVQAVFVENGFIPNGLSCNDVCFGRHLYDVEYLDDDVMIKLNTKISTIHYCGPLNWLFLPKEYLTKEQLDHRNLKIRQRSI
jgi:hypothetical protein